MLETQFDPHLLHRAAYAYYLDGLRQAEIADKLGVSRPTVSKLLAEARRIGMVRFEVLDVPTVDLTELEDQLRELLGLRTVRVAPSDQVQREYRGIGDLLGAELRKLAVQPGEAVLISSGQTTHAVSGMGFLPEMPGVVIAPTVGGQQEPDPSFQTNETVRRFADRTRAQPRFIFAPALTSANLWASLQEDPSFRSIADLWAGARAAIVGIGAPYRDRTTMTSVVPRGDASLEQAVGDVCLHFYDADGADLDFPGSEHLVRLPLEQLRAIPDTIAVTVGRAKAPSIRAGAKAGLFTGLITDVPTAEAVLEPAADDAAG